MLIVQKYGGRCVAGTAAIRATAKSVATTLRAGHRLIVTVSAMGRETGELPQPVPEVTGSGPGQDVDMLLTTGDRRSTGLLALALYDLGIPAESFSGARAGIVTDGEHTDARIVAVRTARLRAALEAGRVPVVGGAQGTGPGGRAAFLGRGGTDTTAVALAAAFGASLCEIFTDMPGVFTADPRVVPRARVLPRISFDLLHEMCAAGCLEPATRAVALARDQLVPLRVRSPFGPEPGTFVDAGDGDGGHAVAVVAGPGTPAGEATVSVVGRFTGRGLATATLLAALADADLDAELCDSSPVRLTCAVPAEDADRAAVVLHDAFVEAAGGRWRPAKPAARAIPRSPG